MSEKGKRSQLLTHYLPYTFTTIAANIRNRDISEYDTKLQVSQN